MKPREIQKLCVSKCVHPFAVTPIPYMYRNSNLKQKVNSC